MNTKVYPRTNDFQTIYLNTVIKNPAIIVGDYTIYNDFVNDPLDFEKNNVLYHYPINKDRLIIAEPSSFLTVRTIPCVLYPIIHSLFSLENGA